MYQSSMPDTMIMLLRTETLHIGTLLCKSRKIVHICYDHHSPVYTLDNYDALTDKRSESSSVEYCFVPE